RHFTRSRTRSSRGENEEQNSPHHPERRHGRADVQGKRRASMIAPPGHRTVRPLGQGALATTFVVIADHPRPDASPGALRVCKRLTRRGAEDLAARELFAREGRILAALHGRGAPHLLEAAADPHGPFLVLEYVEMRSLFERAATASRAWRLDAC